MYLHNNIYAHHNTFSSLTLSFVSRCKVSSFFFIIICERMFHPIVSQYCIRWTFFYLLYYVFLPRFCPTICYILKPLCQLQQYDIISKLPFVLSSSDDIKSHVSTLIVICDNDNRCTNSFFRKVNARDLKDRTESILFLNFQVSRNIGILRILFFNVSRPLFNNQIYIFRKIIFVFLHTVIYNGRI